MRWLNPAAFLGLAALVLPVLIHLFSRQQTRVVPFPSLRFVTPSQLLPTRRTQLSDLALLVVRLSILAAAVLALAGPLWARVALMQDASATGAVSAGVTIDVRALVIDTATGQRDSVADYSIDTLLARLRAESKSVMSAYTSAAYVAVPGTVDWLQQQHGSRELVVVSDFQGGTLDSTDLAAIPQDIVVRLVRIPETGARRARADQTTYGGSIVWWNDANRDIQNTMRRAVTALGGHAIDTDRAPPSTVSPSRVVVVASIGTDSVSAQLSRVTALRAPWMGNVLVHLQRDTTLAVAMASVTDIADTTFAAPFVVTSRSAQFAPLAAAAALPAADASAPMNDRLLLVVRTADDAVATAALLLAVSNALSEMTGGFRSGDAAADDIAFVVSDDMLRRWEHAPSAAAAAVRSSLRSDFGTGPSDGRYVWILVLVLVALESYMRRRAASIVPPAPGAERA